MEMLIVLAVIFFVVNALSKGVKQAQRQGKRGQAQPGKSFDMQRPAYTRTPTAPPDPASALEGNAPWGGFAQMLEKLDLLNMEAAPDPEPALEQVSFEGVSMTDDYGCIGGSMPHDVHQGEEFSGHQHRLIDNATIYTQTHETPVVKHASGKLNAGQMRSAVVMAEVLGRPVSMRRR